MSFLRRHADGGRRVPALDQASSHGRDDDDARRLTAGVASLVDSSQELIRAQTELMASHEEIIAAQRLQISLLTPASFAHRMVLGATLILTVLLVFSIIGAVKFQHSMGEASSLMEQANTEDIKANLRAVALAQNFALTVSDPATMTQTLENSNPLAALEEGMHGVGKSFDATHNLRERASELERQAEVGQILTTIGLSFGGALLGGFLSWIVTTGLSGLRPPRPAPERSEPPGEGESDQLGEDPSRP